MDSLSAFSSAIDRERPFSANPKVISSSSSRVGVERDGPRHEPPARPPSEIQPSPSVPRALEGMLRTTTETGDIGIFSTKPSRFPPLNGPRRSSNYNENGLQKPQRAFQPYNVPSVDHRRLLPSYARDTDVEKPSISRTSAAPKSGRVFSDPDHRSYSMIQASCDRLANHRSYTSLRSQVEASDLLERPRSPFGYPTDVRRSAFNTSSPTSTSAGGADHHPRADVDIIRHETSHSTSSPSSLYAQKRKLPVALPPEANRSTSSFLGRSIPPRRSSSPLVHRSDGNPTSYNSGRGVPNLMDTSPTRSTSSRESTTNTCPVKSHPSNATAPVKHELHPPRNEYAEYFDVEDFRLPVSREPAPQLRMTASIPEEQAMVADRASSVAMDFPDTVGALNSNARISSSSASIHRNPIQDIQDPRIGSSGIKDSWSSRKAGFRTPYPLDKPSSKNSEIQDGKRAARFPISEHRAQELSIDAQEAFNHGSFGPLTLHNPQSSKILGNEQREYMSMPISPSNIRQGTREQSMPGRGHEFSLPPFSEGKSDQQHQKDTPERSSSLRFASHHQKKLSLMGPSPADSHVANAVRLEMPSEISGRSESPYETDNALTVTQERTLADSPTIPDHIMGHRAPPHYGTGNHQHQESVQANPQRYPVEQIHYQQRGRQLQRAPVQVASDMANCARQVPRKSVSRDGTPLLAPKAVSPVRQLELKNSVPNLMEALPHIRSDLPATENMMANKAEITYHFSPLVSQSKLYLPKAAQPMPSLTNTTRAANVMDRQDISEVSKTKEHLCPVAPVEERAVEEAVPSLPSHPRLKLKMRKSTVLPQASADNSQAWNSEGNYPGSDQLTILQALSLHDEEPGSSQPPKFTLKVTRASNSTPDTVRINRDCGASRPMVGSQHPSDLFTSSHGIDHIFRQVSKHLHPRKSSLSNSHQGGENGPALDSLGVTDATDKRNPISPQKTSPVTCQTSPIELRSHFSDDSSDAHGHHSLRKRISNLRARLALPYSSKTGAQSYNDVSLRQKNRVEDPAARSVPNLRSNGQSGNEEAPLRDSTEQVRFLKLKAKFSRWLKGARSAIKARIKSLGSNGGRGDGTT
ncbi:uncharacterized protein BP5553_07867 [Venustampulla echinocandica]|uniref:Uncharacterized protein n=1 Tax=Venustampulla echinocandica TaxID=2656787 RepID=A0A370THR5_9HELO|nr:uncharacterized protein BP5553_07867 [Venustampulla echinocandica]RDL34739.1 hypothetical protein BP5553_07867 [Venustampulla echinocandica]